MLTVGQLKKVLETLPDDLGCFAYEGEVTGIIFVKARQSHGHMLSDEVGYVKTTESWGERSDARLLNPEER